MYAEEEKIEITNGANQLLQIAQEYVKRKRDSQGNAIEVLLGF
jgi:hypothetical protein